MSWADHAGQRLPTGRAKRPDRHRDRELKVVASRGEGERGGSRVAEPERAFPRKIPANHMIAKYTSKGSAMRATSHGFSMIASPAMQTATRW